MLSLLKTTIKIKKKYKFVPGKPFNPNFDGNLIALYNGDVGLAPAAWQDTSGNGYDLTLFNSPTIVPNAINGHFAVQFNGVDEYGRRTITPILTQPISIYLVGKTITWANFSRFYTGGDNNDGIQLMNAGGANDNQMYSGSFSTSLNPVLANNTYGIITSIYNNAISEFRLNNNASSIVNTGALNNSGFTIASYFNGSLNHLNCEIAYIIIRSAADNTTIQNIFINFLKNRFAL